MPCSDARKEVVDRTVGALAAIAVNLGLFWLLQDLASRRGGDTVSQASMDTVMRVLFIERRPVQQGASELVPTQPKASLRRPPRAASVATTPSTSDHGLAPASGWASTSPGASLDLSLPSEQIDFSSNPLTRRVELVAPTQDRMALAIQDRSFGGRMQRMTKAGLCRDLRAGLEKSPASASTILASMKRYGCSG